LVLKGLLKVVIERERGVEKKNKIKYIYIYIYRERERERERERNGACHFCVSKNNVTFKIIIEFKF